MVKNFSAYGLPEIVKFCKLCVNSNQKPNPKSLEIMITKKMALLLMTRASVTLVITMS